MGILFEAAAYRSPLQILDYVLFTDLVIDTARIVRGRARVTVRCPSVCPSLCPIHRPLHGTAAGLLLWARRADVDP